MRSQRPGSQAMECVTYLVEVLLNQQPHPLTLLQHHVAWVLQRLPYLCSVAVAGALWIGVVLICPLGAVAAPVNAIELNGNPLPASQPAGNTQLPDSLANRLRQALSKQTQIPANKLRVVEATRQSWSDGCLGLAQADEFCTQAIVEGWRVVLSEGKNQWVYRTDRQGRTYRMETATKRSRLFPSSLLFGRNRAGRSEAIKPLPIPTNQLPPALESQAIFRSISSGGFAGRTYQTVLLKNGQILRTLINLNGATSPPEIRQISPQQVEQFLQVLEQHPMARFDRLNYSAKPGAADFTTVTLSSRSGTLRYADNIQTQLPDSLKAIIQAWEAISRTG